MALSQRTKVRRLWLLCLLAASAAFPQSFSVGVKGGVPLADAFKVTDRSRYFSDKAPYVIGPAVEVHLPLGLSAEVDLLYRNLEYSSRTQLGSSTPLQVVETRTTGQVWEFPFLAKYRVPGVLVRPFVSAGLSYRRLARLRMRSTAPGSTDRPPELTGHNAVGPTLGAGLEFKVRRLRLSSEVRYTRWGTSSFREALSGFASQLNQADFLLGIAF
jgi:opacity protein-like surface antigen